MEIFNKDVSVLGKLKVKTANKKGKILTKDVDDVVKERELAEILVDIGAAKENHLHKVGDITDFPTRTSSFINDGEDNTSTYIEEKDIEDIVITAISHSNYADKNYVHTQLISSKIWNIVHPLNKKVSVTVTDTAGTVIEGRVTINDGHNVRVEFNYPFPGEAILN